MRMAGIRNSLAAQVEMLVATGLAACIGVAIIMAMVAGEARAKPSKVSGAIAFTSDRTTGPGVQNSTGDSEIFTVDPDGSNLRQLTYNKANDYGPDYSRDGTKITFSSDRDGSVPDQDDIFVMGADMVLTRRT